MIPILILFQWPLILFIWLNNGKLILYTYSQGGSSQESEGPDSPATPPVKVDVKVKIEKEDEAEESDEDTPIKQVAKVKEEPVAKKEIFLRSTTIKGDIESKEKTSLEEEKELTSSLRKNEEKKPAAAASASKRKVSFLCVLYLCI